MDLEQLRKMMQDGTLGQEPTTAEKLRDVAKRTPRGPNGRFKDETPAEPEPQPPAVVPANKPGGGEVVERVTLRYRQGNSDKVWVGELVRRSASNFQIRTRWGKHTGTKQEKVVERGLGRTTARKAFRRRVDEKKAKGYWVTADGDE